MNFITKNGFTAKPSKIKDFYAISAKNEKRMGNVHKSYIETSSEWFIEPFWTTESKKKIPYSEVSQQHWSNIYHLSCKVGDTRIKKISERQLENFFNGVILPKKEYFFDTEDGISKYKGDSYYCVDLSNFNIFKYNGSVKLDLLKLKVFHLLYNAETFVREELQRILIKKENKINTTPYFSFEDIEKLLKTITSKNEILKRLKNMAKLKI
jgi:hypothetical protein